MQLDAAHQALKKARAPYRVSLHRKLAHALVEVLEDLEDAQAAREAVQAYRAGETVPWEQAKAELVGCCANPHPATAAPVCETAALAEPPWR